jgi:L-asparagine oxygenase
LRRVDNMNELSIEAAEAEQIRDSHLPFVGWDPRREDTLAAIRAVASVSLPVTLNQSLTAMRNGEYDRGALLVRRLLTDSLNLPTPLEPVARPTDRLAFISEVIHLGIGLVLGEPLAYQAEKSGVLVQHVYPVESEKNAPSNESSASTLDLHTEIAFSTHRLESTDSPDFVLLLCLRADPWREAATLIAELGDLCAELSDKELLVLEEPRFELRAPYSFTRTLQGQRPWFGPIPIIHNDNGVLTGAFDLACGCRGIDSDAQGALEKLRAAALAPRATARVHLEFGDLLILDNRRCAHGRTPFRAGFNGRDRWMQRLYVRRSLAGMQPVDPKASARVF